LLTSSGRFTHISGDPSAEGRACNRENSPVKTDVFSTVPRHQQLPYSAGDDLDDLDDAQDCTSLSVDNAPTVHDQSSRRFNTVPDPALSYRPNGDLGIGALIEVQGQSLWSDDPLKLK